MATFDVYALVPTATPAIAYILLRAVVWVMELEWWCWWLFLF